MLHPVVWCVRDRDAPGLDTVVPLETTAAYNMMDVITGVSSVVVVVVMVAAAAVAVVVIGVGVGVGVVVVAVIVVVVVAVAVAAAAVADCYHRSEPGCQTLQSITLVLQATTVEN